MPTQSLNKKVATSSRIVKSIRISTFHNLMLNQMPGKEYPGILMRMLLDDYFNNKFPEQQKAFKKLVEDTKLKQLKILNNQAIKNQQKGF